MPKVSIIILTYNRAEMLRSAITSALNQTFQDFEVIVVDDASLDNTEEVVNIFRDERIKYMRHEINKGESTARNTGLLNSKGEYIAFLDDDDEWFPEKLGLQVDVLENSLPEVGVVYTGSLCIDKSTSNVDSINIPEKGGDISQEILKKNFIIMSSTLLRQVCFEKVGFFDVAVAYGPDYDMWIRISKFYHFAYIKKPMVKYYKHENKLTTNYSVIIKGFETLLEKYAEDFALDTKYYSKRFFNLGLFYCLNGNSKRSREACLKAIRCYPFEIKYYFLYICSFLGENTFRKILKVYLMVKTTLKNYLINKAKRRW